MAVTQPSAPSQPQVTVPKLNRDPVQSLAPYSVVVSVAGCEMEIPPLPAADWLAVLMAETPTLDDVFPGLLDEEDQNTVEEMIIQGDLDIDEYRQVLLDVIETVSARRWWVALRLIEGARTSWDVLGGTMGLKGIDATQVSLSSWLDVLLLVTINAMEPKDVQMWTMKLEAPPPEEEVAEEDMEMSSAQFMAMA